MILVPRLRRWGALVLGALLVAFMGYFAIHYNALRGADCSCFPWLKRVVGPGFFVGDAVMLLLSGQPIHEPVVGRGPFVMNTLEEIGKAIEDFSRGQFGHVAH